MMHLRKLLLLVILIFLTANIYAQLTKEDSIWIEGIKSGRIKIELTPETRKAIEEGRLIDTEKPNIKLLESTPQLQILKEFSGIRPESDEEELIDLSTLPSSVFILRDIPDSAKRKSFVYVAPPVNYISLKIIPIGKNGFYITAHTGELDAIVKDGQSKGGALVGVGYSFSMEDLLRYAFMPSERAKKRNRKYATAWKFY